MRAVVIEDEKNVRKGFIKMVGTFCPEVEIIAEAGSVGEGLEKIHTEQFDILFLDINLPDGSGFDLMHQVKKSDFALIFITAYDKYAVHAFKLNAVDYLLKPVSPDLLKQAVQRVAGQQQPLRQQLGAIREQLQKGPDTSNKIILKELESIHLVQVSEIIYCQAEGSYTQFRLKDGTTIVTSINLKEYETLLRPYQFIRCHHSYLVNLHQIKELKKTDGSTLVMNSGAQIPVSTRKKAVILEEIKKLFIG